MRIASTKIEIVAITEFTETAATVENLFFSKNDHPGAYAEEK